MPNLFFRKFIHRKVSKDSFAFATKNHGVSRDQLQVYLDEFVFRHNRRSQPMAAFQTLLGLGTGRKPTSYKEIRGGGDLSTPSNID